MIEYFERLHLEFERMRKRRQKVRETARKRAQLRVEHLSEARAGAPPAVLRRTHEVRCRILPQTDQALDELRRVRMVERGTAYSAIIEGVVDLWHRYRFDDVLFIRRCVDPTEADVAIDVHSHLPPTFHYGSKEAAYRMLTAAIGELAQDMHPKAILEVVHTVLEVVSDEPTV